MTHMEAGCDLETPREHARGRYERRKTPALDFKQDSQETRLDGPIGVTVTCKAPKAPPGRPKALTVCGKTGAERRSENPSASSRP